MGELAALGWGLFFASTTVFMRYGASRVSLFWLNAARCLIASLAVAVAVGLTSGFQGFAGLPMHTIVWLGLSTAVAYPLGDMLYFRSSQLIGVSRAMPLSNCYPLVSVLLAVALLGETMSWRLALGTLFILGGGYLVAKARVLDVPSPRVRSLGEGSKGLLLAGLAAIFWGVSVVLDRVAMQVPSVDLLAAGLLRLVLGAIFLFLLAGTRRERVEWRKLDRRFLALLLLVGVVFSAGAPPLWLYAVQAIGAAKASLLAATAPLFGLALSALLLGEKATWRTAGGAALTILGVWFIL
ncbi:MAG: DMT family transporter [Dehalococcoidales bacterium]|nr:DMT family transporter [Dehalococcoidales bacterium]